MKAIDRGGSRAQMTTPQLKCMRESALAKAKKVARNVFAKRGNHHEVHVQEPELVAILAVAFELGAEWYAATGANETG